MKFKKDKSGLLLGEQTVKIIIAAICILILVGLLFYLYYNFTGDQKSKQAEASLNNRTLAEIKRLNEGEEFNEQGIQIPNPSDWFIFGFTGEKKPNKCIGEKCICICEDVSYIFDWEKRLMEKCDDKGACGIVPNLKAFEKIKIEGGGGTAILIKKIGDEIEVSKNEFG